MEKIEIRENTPLYFTVELLKTNKEKKGNQFLTLAQIRNKVEELMQIELKNPEFELEKWQAKNALGHAEKVLMANEQESLAIERGPRNKKMAWRIAEPEDKDLVEKNLEIRLNLSKKNGKNMMNLEMVAKGNDIVEGQKYKGLLQDFFEKAKLLK